MSPVCWPSFWKDLSLNADNFFPWHLKHFILFVRKTSHLCNLHFYRWNNLSTNPSYFQSIEVKVIFYPYHIFLCLFPIISFYLSQKTQIALGLNFQILFCTFHFCLSVSPTIVKCSIKWFSPNPNHVRYHSLTSINYIFKFSDSFSHPSYVVQIGETSHVLLQSFSIFTLNFFLEIVYILHSVNPV